MVFGIVDNHPTRHPTIKRQCTHKCIQHHLLGFTRISHNERLAAMAQTEMRDFDLLLHATQNNVLLAPVKLQCIARFEM